MRRRAAALVVLLALAAPARAYDYEIDSSVVGQGYQVRQIRVGGDRLLNRRRLLGSLRLSLWNLWPRRGPRAPTLSVATNLRYGADFGDFLEESALAAVPELEQQQRQLDVLHAFLDGRGFFGRVDFRLGRQVTVDDLAWFAFDGLTVRVRGPGWLWLEASGGLEVRGAREDSVADGGFELEGGSLGTPERRALSPTVGAALELAGPRWAAARLSYRRTSSASLTGDDDVDRDLAAAGLRDQQAVREERLALSARARLWGGRVQPYGGARLDLLRRELDQLHGGARVRVGRHTLSVDYQNALPMWDGDSIFNVFTQYPTDDVRVAWEAVLSGCLRGELRATARWFHARGAAAEADLGGGGVLEWQGARSRARADAWFADGYGGRHAGLDLSGERLLRVRLGRGVDAGGGDSEVRVDGRLTVQLYRDALLEELEGVSLGAQVGLTLPIRREVGVHVWVEDNVNRFYDSALRVVGVLDLAVMP